ncbi:putative F-box protein At5g50220 [Cornus florida]|uniref:putative F-box protein At5g50220 n=1 Tax=Cornus florida TaxID=4283 RepID=UPI00289ABEA8|nr:putative F-box protein At5g50220 [Cornus florida]
MEENMGFNCSAEKSVLQYIETSARIPTDIIIEILSWLPVKNLLRLKCVCKQWYATIQHHHFIKKHVSRAIVGRYQYNTIAKTPPPANSPPSVTLQFMCGCDGLLLKMNNASGKYFIENPTTRQILELPDPHKGSIDISLSFIPSTGDYKLVSIYDIDGKKAGNEGCEVLTLALPFTAFGYIIGSNIYQDLVSLDVENECFTATALSQDLVPDWKKSHALSWNGRLSFVNRVEEALHVLVLEDEKRQKWGEKFVISLAFIKENQDMMVDLVPLFAQNGDLWFRWKEEKYFAYNLERGTVRHTVVAPEGRRMGNKFYCLPPSLVTLKGMRPQQKAQPSTSN